MYQAVVDNHLVVVYSLHVCVTGSIENVADVFVVALPVVFRMFFRLILMIMSMWCIHIVVWTRQLLGKNVFYFIGEV